MQLLTEVTHHTAENYYLSKAVVIVCILIVTLIISKIINALLNRWQKRFFKSTQKKNAQFTTAVETKVIMARRIFQSAVYIFAFIMILLQFEGLRSLGAGLLASAGIAGIVIGMASQTTLSNLIAGISISFAQPVRLKDAVIFEGEFGWIEEISLMHTTIRTWDNRRIIAPNNVLVNKVIQNWTIKDPSLLGVVMLYVDYTCDVSVIKQWVEEIVEKSPNTTSEKVAVTHVVDFTEKSMQLRILSKGPDAPTTWNLRCEIREKLIQKFKEADMPLPKIRVDEGVWQKIAKGYEPHV